MQRIVGTEAEYGISSPSDPTANPILTSTQAVLAYAAAAGIQRAKRTRWDYEVESPLRDARGFDLSRSAGPPPAVWTSPPPPGIFPPRGPPTGGRGSWGTGGAGG